MTERQQLKARRLARRYRAERMQIYLGRVAIVLVLFFLFGLLADIAVKGWRGFLSARLATTVTLDAAVIGASGENDLTAYERLVKATLRAQNPGLGRREQRELAKLYSFGAAIQLRDMVAAGELSVGETAEVWLMASSPAELHLKAFTALPGSHGEGINLSELQVATLEKLRDEGRTKLVFNSRFFVAGDSRDPELAGIGGALMGSLLALAVTLGLTFPIAVCAAIYLEMLAPRNRFFDIIEANINNLAAVPSVIMGLLGLAVMINLMGMPRSTPLVGGLVLGLLTLPTIIIAARSALKAVPKNLLEGALSLGATRLQGIFDQVLPAAMPGILTGTIIGMAGALGETAPLLMVGMVAFVVAVPDGLFDVATALPVQIYLWADSPERGFVERISLGISVLIGFLLMMNALAIYLRHHFERYK